MKYFTKLTALLLALMVAWCMAACSAPKTEVPAAAEQPAETETAPEPAAYIFRSRSARRAATTAPSFRTPPPACFP